MPILCITSCFNPFIGETQKGVDKDAVLRLYNGNVLSVSISLSNSLCYPSLTGFIMEDECDQRMTKAL